MLVLFLKFTNENSIFCFGHLLLVFSFVSVYLGANKRPRYPQRSGKVRNRSKFCIIENSLEQLSLFFIVKEIQCRPHLKVQHYSWSCHRQSLISVIGSCSWASFSRSTVSSTFRGGLAMSRTR